MSPDIAEGAFDFIIVGGGSAGCVLANRLSADPAFRVCLVEGGGQDTTPRIQVPAGTITLYKSPKYAYQFYSEPQRHLNDRRIHVPRGRALGGSSAINSMIYIRGHRSDYDTWAQMGCPGWSYDELLPYFKRSERNLIGQDPDYHGAEGELLVDTVRDHNPVSDMFVEAAEQVGLERTDDFNGPRFEGVGIYNVTQRNGQRLSSYRAFLKPIESRANLTIMTGCAVHALTLNGTKVTGVRIERDGRSTTLQASREVILAAGALGSPQILMASGIGDGDMLAEAGISVRHHLPAVGRNLQDHLDGLVTLRSDSPKTLGFSMGSLPDVVSAPFRYLARRKGWLTTNYVEAGGFACTKYADGIPDVQFHFVPGFRSHRGRLFEWNHGFAIHTCLLRPQSRGTVRLARNSQGRSIEIDFNFLDSEQDGRVLVEGLKLARRILNAPAFDLIRGREMAPGPDVVTDDDLMAYLRRAASTVFHPSGTCRMGTDPQAVVTPDLKVCGLQGVRVADASIMPTLISGNTNAPSIMIGEKAAEACLRDAA